MASVAIRPVSEKFTRVPNAFIENQHLFKLPASRALALITFRSEQDQARWHGKITDAHWESWTGLGVRAKELACKELAGFGLETEGRGDKTTFSWNWDRWQEAIRDKHQGEYDPKRKDREAKAVTAKPGANVHEECAGQGCAMLRAGNCPGTNESIVNDTKPASLLFLTPIAQPVTQTVEQAAEKAWALTLATLCSFFPLIGAAFLMRLLQVVRGVFPSITDQELAAAIGEAFFPEQFSHKAFLISVPNAILRMRRKKKALEDIHANDGRELPHILPGMEKAVESRNRTLAILNAATKGRHSE